MLTGRSWWHGQPVFVAAATLTVVIPDEHDLVEVGRRVALAYAAATYGHPPHVRVAAYRAYLPPPAETGVGR